MAHKFKIGDRVTVPEWYGTGEKEATVCDVDGSFSIGVAFDSQIEHRHNCAGRCGLGHGWYFNPKDLTLISRATPKTKQDLITEKIKYLETKFKTRVKGDTNAHYATVRGG